MTTLTLDSRPEPLAIDLKRTAVLVVDMQNAFASRGGLLDLAGVDITAANAVVRRDFQIVDALAPRADDVVVLKTRYSGFASTQLDSLLRVRDIRYLVFVGIATNVCVESTLRDAYFHEYWPILVTDGAMQAGPPEAHAATVFNVESFFGWTLGSRALINAFNRSGEAHTPGSG
jgi:nicotinamidase-related amidase